MSRVQCVLSLVAWYVGVVHSWDYAVSVGDKLIFYTNDGNNTDTVHFQSRNLGGLAYDEVHNVMLYVDKQNNNDAVCGYHISSREDKCFIERNGRNIDSIAYDPATEKIFFTDTNEKSINWIALKRESNGNIYGNLLIKMQDRTPIDIAVDSCKGYIYWSVGKNMERARLNGAGRQAILLKYQSFNVFSLAIDPQIQKMYYVDGFSDQSYLNYADLDGKNEHPSRTINTMGKEITVTKDYIYWMTTNGSYTSVWLLPEHNGGEEPKEISKFYTGSTLGIAVNYKIADQIKGIDDCDLLSSLIPTITGNSQRSDVSVCDNYCLQGNSTVNDEGIPKCRCNAGYTGPRCEVYACHGYCLYGNCSLTDDGLPTCSCDAGYSGDRCEVSACHGYCLNDGHCFLDEEDQPACQCIGNHEGSRCEADINDTTPTYDSTKRNITLADLLSRWRKPYSKMYLTVEV